LRRNARASADPDAAMRCAHTLKGSAANMGARAVQQSAAELEQACRDGAASDRIDDLLGAVLRDLQPVMAALEGIGHAPDAPVGADEPVAHAFDQVQHLTLLKNMLECADPSASDQVQLLMRASRGTPMDNMNMLRQLESAVEQFDYDAALALLQAGWPQHDANDSSQPESEPKAP